MEKELELMELSSISHPDGSNKGVRELARVSLSEKGGGGADHHDAKGVVVVGEEKGDENLKTKIMEHPLYELLLKRHMDCLKVCSGEFGEADGVEVSKQTNSEPKIDPAASDLDLFMETYCVTLSKLKEAMEAPLQETASFAKAMYDQLEELRGTHYCRFPDA